MLATAWRPRYAMAVAFAILIMANGEVCEDTPGEVAQDDETGEILKCSDMAELCADQNIAGACTINPTF